VDPLSQRILAGDYHDGDEIFADATDEGVIHFTEHP